jgi:hypothetical protein
MRKILAGLAVAITLSLGLIFLTGEAVTPVLAQEPPVGEIDSGSFMFDLNPIVHEGITGSTKQSWIRQGVNYFFERIIGFMAGTIGTLALLMISVGGFLVLSSAGNETQYQKGLSYVKYGAIGLAITLSAYILVTLVQLLITSIYGS